MAGEVTPGAAAAGEDLPLAGLRVVELHAIGPVPFAGMVLRQLGAEVTRVSPPQDPGLGVAMPPQFDLLNRHKKAVALDLKQTADREAMARLLETADVLLEGFRPGVLERLGLAPQVLLQSHPRLVIGRLSGWGDRGPFAARAGHDINYLALTGVLAAIGRNDHPMPPLNLVADFGGGAMHLLVGVLARLVRRGLEGSGGSGGSIGRGGVVTTSIAAGTVGLTPMFYGLLAAGQWRLQRESNLLDGGAPFYRTYACAGDGFVAVGALEQAQGAARLPAKGQRDQAEREVAAEGEDAAGVFRQQQRCHEDAAPDQAGAERMKDADQHVGRLGEDGRPFTVSRVFRWRRRSG